MQQYLQGLEQQPAFQKGLQQVLKGQPVSSLQVPPATSTSAGVPRLPIQGELQHSKPSNDETIVFDVRVA